MVKERNEQTGGEVIAAGGYGCVFAPPLPCANKPRELMESRRPAGVSKLLKETDLDEEVKIEQYPRTEGRLMTMVVAPK